jgi:hypothetical protein
MFVPPYEFIIRSNACENNRVKIIETLVAVDAFSFFNEIQFSRCRLFVIYAYYIH